MNFKIVKNYLHMTSSTFNKIRDANLYQPPKRTVTVPTFRYKCELSNDESNTHFFILRVSKIYNITILKCYFEITIN